MTDIADSRAQLKRDSLVIGLVGSAHFSSHFFQLSLAPLFKPLHEAFDVNYVTLGSLVTCFYLTSGICQAFAGILVDRVGPRPMLLAGIAGMATCIGLAGLVPTFWMFYPLMVLAGIANSVFHPADFSLLSHRVSKERLGRAYSVHAFAGTAGYAVAPKLVAAFAGLGWRVPLIAAGLLGWLVVLLLVKFSHELSAEGTGRARSGGRPMTYAQLVTAPAILMAFSYFLLTAAAGTGFQTFSTTSLVDFYGVTLEAATSVLTAYLVGSATGILLGGLIADRTSRHALVAVIGLASCAALMMVVATGALAFGTATAAIALAGLCQGMTAPSRDILIKAATPPGATGKVFGFVYSGLDAGSTVAPLLFGMLMDNHANHAIFAGFAVLYAVAIVSVLSVSRRGAAAAQA